jgi:hypothetical protein
MDDDSKNDAFIKRLDEEISELESGLIKEKELFLHEAIDRYGHVEASNLLLKYNYEFIKKFDLKHGRSPVHFFKVKGDELSCFSVQDDNLNDSIVGMSVIPDVHFDFSSNYTVISKKNSGVIYYPISLKLPFRENLTLKVPIFFSTYLVKKEPSGIYNISDFFTAKRIGLTDSVILSNHFLELMAKRLGIEYSITSSNRIGDQKTADLVFSLLKKNEHT